MYNFHRQQFEQLLKMLLGWQRIRLDEARAANQKDMDRTEETQRRLALQIADQTAQRHQHSDADSDSDSAVESEPSAETPGTALMRDVLEVFNASEQELWDFQIAIRELNGVLLRLGPRIPRAKAFEVRRIVERLTVEMHSRAARRRHGDGV